MFVKCTHAHLPLVPFIKLFWPTVETAGDEAWPTHLKDACSPEESSDAPLSFLCCSSYERIDCRASCFLYEINDVSVNYCIGVKLDWTTCVHLRLKRAHVTCRTTELAAIISNSVRMLATGSNKYLFSRLPFPVSRNPFAKGLWSIFSCVIWNATTWKQYNTNKDNFKVSQWR